MLTGNIRQLGETLVDELKGERKSVTQRWMAHFIAELIYRAENSEDKAIAEEAQIKCADLILRLWNSELESARVRIENSVYRRFEEVDSESSLNQDFKGYIHSLQNIDEWKKVVDVDLFLYWLSQTEQRLIRLRITARVLADMEKNSAIDAALKELPDVINYYKSTLHLLSDIWPEVANLNIENMEETGDFVIAHLQELHRIREDVCNFVR